VCGAAAQHRCSACKTALYCGVRCQTRDWSTQHALQCVGERSPYRRGGKPTSLTPNYPLRRAGQTFIDYIRWLWGLGGEAEVEADLEEEEHEEEEEEEAPDVDGKRVLLTGKCGSIEVFIQKLIGKGAYGKVFSACSGTEGECRRPENYRIVVKFQILANATRREDFARELDTTRLASENGIGPQLYYGCVVPLHQISDLLRNERIPANSSIGVMVFERWDMDLKHFAKTEFFTGSTALAKHNRKFVIQEVTKKRSELNSLGIIHGDLKSDNVLIKLTTDNRISAVCLADFGFSFSRFSGEPRAWLQRWRVTDNGMHIFQHYMNYALFDSPNQTFNEFKRLIERNQFDAAEEMFLQIPTLLDKFFL
jgi:hypothetical protein